MPWIQTTAYVLIKTLPENVVQVCKDQWDIYQRVSHSRSVSFWNTLADRENPSMCLSTWDTLVNEPCLQHNGRFGNHNHKQHSYNSQFKSVIFIIKCGKGRRATQSYWLKMYEHRCEWIYQNQCWTDWSWIMQWMCQWIRHHWFRYWLVAFSAPNHCLNKNMNCC